MIRKIAQIAASLIVVAVISGCGMSSSDIEETVRLSMQETLNADPDLGGYNLKVQSVRVFKKGGNAYKGLASIAYKGALHDVSVEVMADGYDVMWEAAPGAFMFLAQEELRSLFR